MLTATSPEERGPTEARLARMIHGGLVTKLWKRQARERKRFQEPLNVLCSIPEEWEP